MSDAWRQRLEAEPPAEAVDPGGRVLVLSAHPDDEVLAIGSWLSRQRDRELVFVTATDGEASHPGSTAITPDELRLRRPRELVHALSLLGVEDPQVERLQLPDGGLHDEREQLRRRLRPLVADADLVIAPFEADGHPDHDAMGEVALELTAGATPLWRYPVWTWAWTVPDDQWWWGAVRRLDSTTSDRARKRRALAAFVTQVQPLSPGPDDQAVVDGALLQHAMFAPEVVIA
ncbi:PIG-L deacetylase family protein [Aeromicrobium stalagmiti]|uniref:PIG-L deacetylase family protein n=1 Tax=Aeromicrobium stalagmiti TaxID=2738988 RepID=UPI00156A24FA|nr:PIG-L family deacetylase [Aeromicrobium stalagmiti]NRQ49646.1 PIG-L family deacetylase [Aeromicrobium stalagmiti]